MISVPGPFTLSVVCMTTDAMPSVGTNGVVAPFSPIEIEFVGSP